ncbi:MAG: bifunctional methyltransferase/pyrophosphohydrolase YabN [Bacillota bacterium]
MPGKIVVVGMGPGSVDQLPQFNQDLLVQAEKVFLRTEQHPTVEKLARMGMCFQTFDYLYEQGDTFEKVYSEIIRLLFGMAEQFGEVVYAVPGHPMVGEATVMKLIQRAEEQGIEVGIIPAMSCLDAIFAAVRLDPMEGITCRDALDLPVVWEPYLGHIITQVHNQRVASEIKLSLMDAYPDEYTVTIVRAAGVPGEEQVVAVPLYELDRLSWVDHLTSIYVPKNNQHNKQNATDVSYPLDPLVEIMNRLRSPDGCPWDRQQTHHTLKQYLIEETYEVLEAIDEGDMYKLCEELGDLLLQVVFHTQLARERGQFDINQVVEGITEKMIRRHPHVFGEVQVETAEEVLVNWEKIKAREKGGDVYSPLEVPKGLPALLRAHRVQGKAAKFGFDWPDVQAAWPKINEETGELFQALHEEVPERVADELGDLLFAVVNVARLSGNDPESALNGTTERFIRRFGYMQDKAKEKGIELDSLSLAEMDVLWEEAKINPVLTGKSRKNTPARKET